MKITIYKLLRLINDGKAPKKIKYDDIVLEYNEEIEDYNYYDGKGLFEYKFETSIPFLDDKVEIIEKSKKIEKMKCSVGSWFSQSRADTEIIKKNQ